MNGTIRPMAAALALGIGLTGSALAECGEEWGWSALEPEASSLSIAYELTGTAALTEGRHCTRFNRWSSEHYIHYEFNGGDPVVGFYFGDLTSNAIWTDMDEWDDMDETVDTWREDLSDKGIDGLDPTGETGVISAAFGTMEYAWYGNDTVRCLFVMNPGRREDTDKMYDGYFCSTTADASTVDIFPAIIGTKQFPNPRETLVVTE